MKKYLLLLLVPFALFACKKTIIISTEDQAKLDKAIIQKYIKDSSLVADSTTSGLYYVIADSGIGANPNATSRVTVYYKGYLVNGTVFDKNLPGIPTSFLLGQLIPAWSEGIPLIKKGGKIKLLIPSALGYGNQEKTGGLTTIPANSVIIFDVELDGFQ